MTTNSRSHDDCLPGALVSLSRIDAALMPAKVSTDVAAGLGFLHSRHGAIIVANDAPRWTILAVNDVYLALTHKTRDGLGGQALFEAFPQSHDTDAERGTHNVENSLVQAAAGETNVLPAQRYDIRPEDGSDGFVERWWQLSSTPLHDESGAVVAVLHDVENVTALRSAESARATLIGELKERNTELEASTNQLQENAIELEAQAEELQAVAAQLEERTEEAESARRSAEAAQRQLMTVLENTPSAIGVTLGREHRFIVANHEYQKLVGRAVKTGQTFSEAMPELVEQGFERLLTQVLETGVPYSATEAPATVTKQGVGPLSGWYDFTYQPLLDADGHPIGVLQQGVDVTRQVNARKLVEDSRAIAENANKAKSEFLAVMSHELRTPLNAIDGYAELLEMGIRGEMTPEQREDIGRIRKSQRHLLGLINEVLNYTRVEGGRVTYDISDVSVPDTLVECEALIAPQMFAKGLQFDVKRCEPSWTVRADPEKLRQVILNLLSNALKFTDAGGRVELECTCARGDARVIVRDTGRGIPADQVERIFEPFVQVDAGLTRTQSGVGLGLAISRDLARGMGGELTAVSEVSVGSVFTLVLPTA
jgi:signal transduction histidine kinase